MPTTKLTTKRAVDALPYPAKGQLLYWDTDLRGFGVVVGVRNKSFVVQRDVKGRSRRITIGRYGEGGISLHAARKQAEQLAGEMRGGIDPVEEERKVTADGMTLREAWGLYEAHLATKERSPRTRDGYWKSLERYCKDWLDRPLVEITTNLTHSRHIKIGDKHGKYAANGTMRALRAIWRRAKRQHKELPESPTGNVDFYKEKPRDAVVKVEDLPSWWMAVKKIENPVRRDFFIWLLFTGCRRGESETLRWEQVDFKARSVHFPVTKTDSFDLPLSDFLVNLLKARRDCESTRAIFGDDNPWVFPAFGKTGHVTEPKLHEKEAKLFPYPWSPHTLRHSYISISENKISMPSTHSRLLTNHAVPKSRDAHVGYIHPDLEDLRKSQTMMSKFLLGKIKPKAKKEKPRDNVVYLKKSAKK